MLSKIFYVNFTVGDFFVLSLSPSGTDLIGLVITGVVAILLAKFWIKK